MTTVKDIYDYINKIAPFSYTDSFDNTGLLVGEGSKEVTKILLALDITNDVIDEAVQNNCNMIVSHHPIIFNPLKKLNDSNPACKLLKNNINAVSAHTNYDMALGGISDMMAELLGLENTGEVIDVIHSKPYCQLIVFVPKDNAHDVYKAMSEAGGGEQGNYSGCAFQNDGEGCFIPRDGSNPFMGSIDKLEKVLEVRIEMLVKPSKVNAVVSAMKKAHPYEEPAYSILENHALYENIGYGRMCISNEPMTAKSLAEKVKTIFGCEVVRYTDTDKPIKKIALCSGSGGGDYLSVYERGADAYITGDVKHDQWIGASNINFSLIDGGHFYTENIAMEYLKKGLKNEFPQLNIDIAKSNIDVVKYLK